MNLWSTVFTAIAVIVLVAIAVFFVAGPEKIWSLAGSPDLGPVDFETLTRRKSPNDSLACPAGTCLAKSDMVPPIFAVGAPELQKALAKVLASEPRLEPVARDESGFTQRYVQRSRVMKFPDTIVVKLIDLGEGRSTLALYSRSQLGESDLGVNRARIARWLDKLTKEAPVVRTA